MLATSTEAQLDYGRPAPYRLDHAREALQLGIRPVLTAREQLDGDLHTLGQRLEVVAQTWCFIP